MTPTYATGKLNTRYLHLVHATAVCLCPPTSGPSDRAAEMDLDHASPAAEACVSARAAAFVCSPDMRFESDYTNRVGGRRTTFGARNERGFAIAEKQSRDQRVVDVAERREREGVIT